MTDRELRENGTRILLDALGEVDAERFIMLLNRDPFDYTTWQKDLFEKMDINEISARAMRLKNKSV